VRKVVTASLSLGVFVLVSSSVVAAQRLVAAPNYSNQSSTAGTVWAWGSNWYGGQLGQDPATVVSNPIPTQVNGIFGVIAIAAGVDHSVALNQDGTRSR
jgi:hypothetical protein